MTREEVIKQLQNCKDLIKQDGQDYLDERDIPILDMAIEALKADVARWSSWNKTFEQSGIADLISRANAVSREEYEEVKAYMDTLVNAFIEDGEELAESVKVVRCKDCKHWHKTTLTTVDGEPLYDCPLFNGEWGDENGYCHHGERREP